MKHEVNEPSFKDPVCGMQVSRTTVVDELDYQGKSYYFCASVCRESFEAARQDIFVRITFSRKRFQDQKRNRRAFTSGRLNRSRST